MTLPWKIFFIHGVLAVIPNIILNLVPGEYVDVPTSTSILGAAKLTGKTKNGLSYGILESVTAREKAEIDNEGERRF